MSGVPERLGELVRTLFPGARIERVELLGPDAGTGSAHKVDGYGRPLRVEVKDARGAARTLVFRTATSNIFGHDRRADRAAGMLLAFDSFADIPNHVRALDVGVILRDGTLRSVADGGEFYLLTGFAEGTLYSEDLRRVVGRGEASAVDLARCEALARWLSRLHAERIADADAYTRAVRDLLGHGEGIFGMIDGYGPDVPAASVARLRAIEERCLAFRWRLRGRETRLSRIHGDFHPFNVVFEPGEGARFKLLDASRGCKGDPADDVTAMAVNFVFFAVDQRAAWRDGLAPLWQRFWDVYLRQSRDRALLDVLAPWLAWRCLVVASPRFYPDLSARGRDALLSLAERALEAGRFDPRWAGEIFA